MNTSTPLNPLSDSLLTIGEVAKRLAVCRRTIEREIAAGRFPRPLRIGKAARISSADLAAYMERLRTQGAPQQAA